MKRRFTISALTALTMMALISAVFTAPSPTRAGGATQISGIGAYAAPLQFTDLEGEAASAGTTQVSGIGVFNNECQPPAGSPPDDLGDYPPIDLSGSLDGCWYTYVSASKFNPSGTYQEQGTEIFVGCLNGTTCGTFETTYTFTAKYVDDTFAEEIHGRCHHPIVAGTGDFAGAKGVILFKDDVVNLKYDYRGHISLQ